MKSGLCLGNEIMFVEFSGNRLRIVTQSATLKRALGDSEVKTNRSFHYVAPKKRSEKKTIKL